MSRHFITFLGTSDYGNTTYRWESYGDCETAFVAAAMGRLWGADAITALCTEEARRKNGPLLEQALQEAGLPAAHVRPLPHGRDQAEQWQQFSILRDAVVATEGGEVLVDITHSFRAQPFFAAAVLSVLRAAGDDSGQFQVAYGEYRKAEPVSPIWDLTLFSELIDWAQALGLFLRTGVAGPVVELGRDLRKREVERVRAAGSRDFPHFHALIDAIERFADDLATVRVASLITGYAQDDRQKPKARGSARLLLEAIAQCREEVAAKLPPLALILDRLGDQLGPLVAERLCSPEGQQAMAALARHYRALGRYPEAAAVVREGWVSRGTEPAAVEVNDPGFSHSRRKAGDREWSQLSGNLGRTVAAVRNDIEHAGFVQQPASGPDLKNNISALVDRFERTLEEPKAPETADDRVHPGRCYFVSRHPGAVEWARGQGITVDRWVEHLEVDDIRPGDTVIGSLPVNLAAQVCARGARYLHLSLPMPAEWRGRELGAEELRACGARLEAFQVEAVEQSP